MLRDIRKWEARVIGALAIGGLSLLLGEISPTPPVVVIIGLIAGAIAGGAVWEQTQQQR